MDALPPPIRGARVLLGVPASGRRWSAGVRAAVAFGIPALVLAVAGHASEALLVVSGSVAVVYGERRPYRVRWKIVAAAGAALVASVSVGALSSQFGDGRVAPVVALTGVAVIAVYVVAALRLGPPGAFFFVLVCAMSSYLPGSGIGPAEAAGFAAFGALSALATSMAGAVWVPTAPEMRAVDAAAAAVAQYEDTSDVAHRHRAGSLVHHAWNALHDARSADPRKSPAASRLMTAHHAFAALTRDAATVDDPDADVDSPDDLVPLARPSIAYRLRRSATPASHAVTTSVRVALGALGAGALCIAADLGRPDWAVLGAVLVLQQGPDRAHGTYRGVHRIVGTVLGVAVFATIASSPLSGVGTLCAVAVLLFAIETTMPRNYGLAVVFITPLALVVGSLSHPGAALPDVVRDRIVETVLGVVCAFVMLWLVLPHGFRRAMHWSDARVEAAIAELATVASSTPMHDDEVARLRRDLQFELVGSALAAAEAAHDDRAWTRTRWSRHARIDRLGYALLAACWHTPPYEVLPDATRWATRP